MPAEEDGGGKIRMIKNKCFEEVDFIMMVHRHSYNVDLRIKSIKLMHLDNYGIMHY